MCPGRGYPLGRRGFHFLRIPGARYYSRMALQPAVCGASFVAYVLYIAMRLRNVARTCPVAKRLACRMLATWLRCRALVGQYLVIDTCGAFASARSCYLGRVNMISSDISRPAACKMALSSTKHPSTHTYMGGCLAQIMMDSIQPPRRTYGGRRAACLLLVP